MIITVAVPVPIFQHFDYLTPDDIQSNFKPEAGMRVLVPFSGRQVIGIILSSRSSTDNPQGYKLKSAIQLLDQQPSLTTPLLNLIMWASQYYCYPVGECLHTALPVALRKLNKSEKSPQPLSVCKWHRTDKVYIPKKQISKEAELIRAFDRHPSGIWHDTLKLMNYSGAQLRSLEKKGYLTKELIDPLSAQHQKKTTHQTTEVKLNTEQLNALEVLNQHNASFQVSLLHGVTGSGKTEVYIEAAREAISQGKQTLILIPEINLTPQTLARFQSQLTSPIGLIHSAMSEREKLTMWHLAKNGVAEIIIGTRSAIFTPFKKLGLIIVDEEHDSSFKQSEGFKYSARDLAVKRGQIESIPVVLGSATPSLESLLNAHTQKYHYIRLTQRAGSGKLPEIHLIDIKSRALEHGCSRPLIQRIRQELDLGHQVIIFQNRRGYSPTLLCSSCGWIAHCPNCDARLTLHSKPAHLHCHHCDFKEALPPSCKSCGHAPLSPLGTGTERIESGLANFFPDIKITRIDRDNIKKQHDMKRLVEKINLGEPCILVGTQMLAKGHDFHQVTLVAVIDADNSLFSSDFRAFEHSTQLLLQVAGRTGRGEKSGCVLIQTKYPDHSLFEPILTNNYDLAAKRELEERNLCKLPPYSKMISLRAESPSQTNNFTLLTDIKRQLIESLPAEYRADCQISGPVEASMPRKSGIFRAYLHIFTLQTKTRAIIQQQLPFLTSNHKSRIRIIIDVDPLEYI